MGLPCLPEIFNFAAGPGVMPAAVLAEAQREFLNWHGSSLSMLEMPFTGDAFKGVLRQARDDLLGRAHSATPVVFNYQAQAEADSMLNTPITFAVYLAGLVFRWIASMGGIETMARNSARRSALLYNAIDDSDGFYCCPVQHAHRSHMNVCFTLADAALTPLFLSAAAVEGLLNLKGHPMTGGIRASLYNAMPDAGVMALIAFMQRFVKEHRYHV